LAKTVHENAGADLVARWAKDDEPPLIVPLVGGSYVRLDRKGDDDMWEYEWRAHGEIKNGG
jgi:hypothetical protein